MKIKLGILFAASIWALSACTGVDSESTDITQSSKSAALVDEKAATDKASSAIPDPTPVPPKLVYGKVNDTAQTNQQCYTPTSNVLVACNTLAAQTLNAQQDGMFGLDVTQPNSADGQLGFRFVKIGATGNALPANATSWRCVQDMVTGLIWENKDAVGATGSLHDPAKTYTNLGNNANDDVSTLISAVNATVMCGQKNWHLPSTTQLLSIVDFGALDQNNPNAIDANYFINNVTTPTVIGTGIPVYKYHYWTGEQKLGSNNLAYVVEFMQGQVVFPSKTLHMKARLVSSANVYEPTINQPYPQGRFMILAGGTEVRDMWTGAFWQRCLVGQTWSSALNTCTGTASQLTFDQALAAAKAAYTPTKKWTIPNIKELNHIVDRQLANSIDAAVFPNNASYVLSSTLISNSNYTGLGAWGVDFTNGNINGVSFPYNLPVRLVRY